MFVHCLQTLFSRAATAGLGLGLVCAYACAQPSTGLVAGNANTNTSVPVSQAGGTATDSPNSTAVTASTPPATGGLLLSLDQNPNKCLGVDTLAAGGNVILRACDGNSAVLWTLTSGQLRLNNLLCLDVASAASGATSLESTATFSVAVCDATRTAQRIDISPDGGLGPNLGSNRYDLSVTETVALGSQTHPVLHGQSGSSKWNVFSTTDNKPGLVGYFALRFADNSNACLILDSTKQPAVQTCSLASNVWWYSSLGSFTDGNSNCLAVDASSGKLSMVSCSANAANPNLAKWGTYGAQISNKGTAGCIAFSPPIFGSSTVLMSNCANQEGQFFTLAPIY